MARGPRSPRRVNPHRGLRWVPEPASAPAPALLRDMPRPRLQHWACPLPPCRTTGHAQRPGSGMNIVPICPLPATRGGHVPRVAADQDGWTCPVAGLRNGHAPSGPAGLGTCPAAGLRNGHSADMSIARDQGRACPSGGRGPGRLDMSGGRAQKRTCPLRPCRATGHAQRPGSGMNIVPICPLPATRGGHVPRGARSRTAGHARRPGSGMDIVPVCPFPATKGGHVPRTGGGTCGGRLSPRCGVPGPFAGR